ncbi:DUF2835 family protein [Modicisalibacter radicis]|uniref:DUF2835 family protein n=1 Tax=Halomonas sp. EAR18 TaxID=2518972 RepID=UPI00109D1693|nr:DUF2835 family protein [Halomonas sp. EAR18]
MPSIDVVIELSAEQCLAHYAGGAQHVYARSRDGRRVVFPAQALRRIVGRDGVHGLYRLTFTADGKFESLVALRAR